VCVPADRPLLEFGREESLLGLERFGRNERWPVLLRHRGPALSGPKTEMR